MDILYLKNVLCIAVVDFDVDLSQEVLQLLQVHLVVIVFVGFSHAVDDPAGIWM